MARTTFTNDSYPVAAVPSTLVSGISDSATSFNITPGTGWSSSNMWAIIDRKGVSGVDGSKEELIHIQTNSSGALSNVVRGDTWGTGAYEHAAGAPIEIVAGAVAIDEMAKAVARTIGKITTAEDILVGTAANDMKRLGIGAADEVLMRSGSALAYGKVAAANLAATLSKNDIRTSDPTGGDLYEGRRWTRSDQDKAYIYDGTAAVEVENYGAWTSYTPDPYFGTGLVTVNNGTRSGAYMRTGRMITGRARYVVGSTDNAGGATGNVGLTLPVQPATAALSNFDVPGGCQVSDASPLNTYTANVRAVNNTGSIYVAQAVRMVEPTTFVSTSVPFAFGATGDVYAVTFTYEAAS